MPRRRSQSTVRALVLGALAVVLGIGLVVGLSVAANHGDVELKGLGAREFRFRADQMAKAVDRDGPRLYSDVSGGTSRDIFVQHVGGHWYAIAAGPRTCSLTWTG